MYPLPKYQKRGRRAMTLDDFTEKDLEALRQMQAPDEAAAFDHEVKN
jgi:hypothetical protein